MSHQTGIQASAELQDVFQRCYTSADIRMVKIVIEDEVLVPAAVVESQGGDEAAEYDSSVLPVLEDKQPCYILYRLDSTNAQGHNYTFISWSPDWSHVRQKMLYAATRGTLKSTFGAGYISEEMFGTVEADVCLKGFEKHKVAKNAPAPLSDAELEKAEIRAAETGVEIGASTKRSVTAGVQFPFDDDLVAKLAEFQSGDVDFIQMSVDTAAERIRMNLADNMDADSAGQTIPDDEARYSLFRFKHAHESENFATIVFVYSCPGYKLPVKQRMLFASCKNPVMETIEQHIGVPIESKLEISEASEFSYEALYNHIHPAKIAFKAKFARPPPPSGRRLTSRSKKE